jgi:hypothetical protein
MALSEEVWTHPAQVFCSQEIDRAELCKYKDELRRELELVCGSPSFRTSPKSREFLRHVVLHTLEGNVDLLKERLIGMALMGRDASYDTSTDAGVRVRANDVRKRLNVHNRGQANRSGLFFTLPPGVYVPLFQRSQVEPSQTNDALALDELQTEPQQPLSLYQLIVPTLAALFLCIVCMRWQLVQEHRFTDFWQHVLQGDGAFLYLPPSRVGSGPEMVAMQGLKVAAPLLDLAGEFHHRFTPISTFTPSLISGGMLVYINVVSGQADKLGADSALPDRQFPSRANRFVAQNTVAGRAIFDRKALYPQQPLLGRAALFTMINGPQRLIYIDGTDDAAIRMLVDRLCDQATFPTVLDDSLGRDTMIQALFPAERNGEVIIVRQPLPRLQADLERWP